MDFEEGKLNFTFAGCGFMGIYHIGVASCLREYAPPHILKHKIGGASAGSMVAALLLCDAPLGQCTSWTLSLAAKARQRSLGPMHPSFNITEYLRYGLDEILPENAHELCNGRLHVSMTRVRDGKNVIFTEFASRDELIQALLCSSFIPFWSGLVPPMFRGERYIDGAASDNLPRIDSYTITVSPFAGRSDICPKDSNNNIYYMYLSNTSIQFSMMNLYRISRIMFPPHPEKLSEICKQGFEDALAYLKRNELVNCSRHLAIRSVLSRRTDSICCNMDELYDEDEDDECMEMDCEHCIENHNIDRQLHPSVTSALEEAVSVVNSNYVMYMKNTKPYRTMSVICSPLYLPFDMALHTLVKMARWLPTIHHDFRWVLENLMFYARLLSGKVITKGKHTYTAKFICQLAITEFQQTDITSDIVESQSQVITSRTQIRSDQRIGFGLGVSTEDSIELVQDLRDRYLTSHNVTDSEEADTTICHGDKKHNVLRPSSASSRVRSHECSRSTSRCPSRALSRAHSRRPSFNDPTPPSTPINCEADLCTQYMDTFSQCLKVADHREAVLAYYYKDESGQLKTTEIFKLDENEARGSPVNRIPAPEDLVSALAAKKINKYGSTRSVVSAVELEECLSPGEASGFESS